MCMKKKRMGEEERIRTNITLSKAVFNMAVDYKINLSQFLENQLLNYFAMRQQIFNPQNIQYVPDTYNTSVQPSRKTPGKTNELYGGMGLLRFERKSLAPKAKRMDQATLQAPAYTV